MTRPAPQVIGICGGKGQGKDTVAQHLTRVYNMEQLAFASPVKTALIAMFGVSSDLFYDPALKEVPSDELLGHTPRRLMTTLGTEWGRHTIDQELWVKLLARRLDIALRGGFNVVVSDVRFDNEARVVLDRGGEIWHVTGRPPIYSQSDHASEGGVSPDLVSRTIVNNADIQSLHSQI